MWAKDESSFAVLCPKCATDWELGRNDVRTVKPSSGRDDLLWNEYNGERIETENTRQGGIGRR